MFCNPSYLIFNFPFTIIWYLQSRFFCCTYYFHKFTYNIYNIYKQTLKKQNVYSIYLVLPSIYSLLFLLVLNLYDISISSIFRLQKSYLKSLIGCEQCFLYLWFIPHNYLKKINKFYIVLYSIYSKLYKLSIKYRELVLYKLKQYLRVYY